MHNITSPVNASTDWWSFAHLSHKFTNFGQNFIMSHGQSICMSFPGLRRLRVLAALVESASAPGRNNGDLAL